MKKLAAVVTLTLLSATVAFAQPTGEKMTNAQATAQQKKATWDSMSTKEKAQKRASVRKTMHEKKVEVQSNQSSGN